MCRLSVRLQWSDHVSIAILKSGERPLDIVAVSYLYSVTILTSIEHIMQELHSSAGHSTLKALPIKAYSFPCPNSRDFLSSPE